MQDPKLDIQLDTWKKLIRELKKRGENIRETGAFLLGKKKERLVSSFICYNDLDPEAFDTGIIVFDGDGFIPLWQHCSAHELKVLADVHTHPSKWTEQSGSDKAHPMIAQSGHLALIVPNFAANRRQRLQGVGIHEFLGEGRWRSWSESAGIVNLVK
jgi:hypothetical protein